MKHEGIYTFSDDRWKYYCLKAYPQWNDYEDLAAQLKALTGLNFLTNLIEGPYSMYIDFLYKDQKMTFMYHDEIGNCIRIKKGDDSIEAEEIIEELINNMITRRPR